MVLIIYRGKAVVVEHGPMTLTEAMKQLRLARAHGDDMLRYAVVPAR